MRFLVDYLPPLICIDFVIILDLYSLLKVVISRANGAFGTSIVFMIWLYFYCQCIDFRGVLNVIIYSFEASKTKTKERK